MKWLLSILFIIAIITIAYIIFHFAFPHKSTLPEMEFVQVPGGSFMMGPTVAEAKSITDRTNRRNTYIKPFFIMTTEVTQQQWEKVMGNNPSHLKGDSLPVDNVSWIDVQLFIRKLNELSPLQGFRLPSEAEWEYACRAGTSTLFYCGEETSDLERAAWYRTNSKRKPHPVGLKKPNNWGLYDMHGNVKEWCQDIYPVENDSSFRVFRGGSWIDLSRKCRSSYRSRQNMRIKSNYCGFRLASDNIYEQRYELIDPIPTHNARDLLNVTSISWNCINPDGDSLMYDVYFGTEPDPPLIRKDHPDTLYMLSELDYETIYFWKIVSKTTTGETIEGSVWGFVTSTQPGLERDFEFDATVDNISMIWIPPGSFEMGSQDQDIGDNNNEVTLSKWFWLSKYEVTQKQWKAVMGYNPAKDFGVGDDYPVYFVSWEDVTEFLNRLNSEDSYSPEDLSMVTGWEKDGKIISRSRTIWFDSHLDYNEPLWRLPTEAEWEFACRVESSARFSWGEDPLYKKIYNYAWFAANSNNRIHPVGLKKPNQWGLHDMSGNVSELCVDVWHPSDQGFLKDGQARSSSKDAIRVIRGGSWGSQPLECSSFSRKPHQGHSSNMVGFRLVRTRW